MRPTKKKKKLVLFPRFFFRKPLYKILQTSLRIDPRSKRIYSPILENLIKLGAFKGESHRICHSSQNCFLSGYRNKHTFYDLHKSIKLLRLALRFLSDAKSERITRFVVVGNPIGQEERCRLLFHLFKLKFFPNDQWQPGFFSKNSDNANCILIVYKPGLSSIAVNEAINACIPIVGFASPTCDIRALDYPLVLNLEKAEIWYSRLITSF